MIQPRGCLSQHREHASATAVTVLLEYAKNALVLMGRFRKVCSVDVDSKRLSIDPGKGRVQLRAADQTWPNAEIRNPSTGPLGEGLIKERQKLLLSFVHTAIQEQLQKKRRGTLRLSTRSLEILIH